MFKKMHEIFAISIILVMLMAVTCYAENAEVTVTSDAPAASLVSENPTDTLVSENSEEIKETDGTTPTTSDVEGTETTGETSENAEDESMLGSDLFLVQTTIDYKRMVDGNVYIMGNDVTVNSVVGGDVFILGNTVTIGKDSLIYGNLYVLANTLTIDGYVYGGDLYAACSEITIADTAAVNRDMRVTTNKLTFNGGLGRNAFIAVNELSVGETAHIYGDFNYSSKEAIQIPSGTVQGTINYSESQLDTENTNPVLDYLMSFIYTLVIVLAILGVMIFVSPKFLSNLENIDVKNILPTLGFGVLGLILPIPVAIILLVTYIGTPVAFALIAVWALLAFILSTPIAIIAIAGLIANKVEVLKKAHNILAILITSLVVWAIGLIPFVGGIVAFLVCVYGLGLIIRNVLKSRKATE